MTALRPATPGDAGAVAALHADSWRRHYRGAYADAFLDGDVEADRLVVWRSRLGAPGPDRVTVLAEDGGTLVGFVHVVLDEDERWGSLVDNLHVTDDRRQGGIGTLLHAAAVGAVLDRAARPVLYLWVLEQNLPAQRFYRARGGVHVETVDVAGGPDRLNGRPRKFRMAWPELG